MLFCAVKGIGSSSAVLGHFGSSMGRCFSLRCRTCLLRTVCCRSLSCCEAYLKALLLTSPLRGDIIIEHFLITLLLCTQGRCHCCMRCCKSVRLSSSFRFGRFSTLERLTCIKSCGLRLHIASVCCRRVCFRKCFLCCCLAYCCRIHGFFGK